MLAYDSMISVLMLCMFFVFPAACSSVWFPYDSGADGTPGNPYKISSAGDLRNISAGGFCDGAFCYKLVCDIDLNNVNWVPLGNNSVKFEGSFDGDGFKIYNLSIEYTESNYKGLFGYAQNSSITNLYISGNVAGMDSIAVLAGRASNCVISNCIAEGSVSSRNNAGGLVGQLVGGEIKNSCFIGNLNGNRNVGGIAGYCDAGKITNCFGTGNVTGNNNVGGVMGFGDGRGAIFESLSLINPRVGISSAYGNINPSLFVLSNVFAFDGSESSKAQIWNNASFFENTYNFDFDEWKMNSGNPYFALPVPRCIRESYQGDASYLAPVYNVTVSNTSFANISASKYKAIEGEIVTLENTLAVGCVFVKYNVTAGVIEIECGVDGSFVMPAHDVFVSADCEIEECTVTFDKGSGDTEPYPASVTVKHGDLVHPPQTEPKKSGYVLSSWRCEDRSWNFTSDVVTSDITLTPEWVQNPITGISESIFVGTKGRLGLLYGEVEIWSSDNVSVLNLSDFGFFEATGAGVARIYANNTLGEAMSSKNITVSSDTSFRKDNTGESATQLPGEWSAANRSHVIYENVPGTYETVKPASIKRGEFVCTMSASCEGCFVENSSGTLQRDADYIIDEFDQINLISPAGVCCYGFFGFKLGDVNMDDVVDISDAAIIAGICEGVINDLSNENKVYANVLTGCDEDCINMSDALCVLRYVTGACDVNYRILGR